MRPKPVVALLVSLVVAGGATPDPATAAPHAGVVAQIAATDGAVGDRVRPYEGLIEPVTTATRPLPPLPTEALATAVTALSAQLGFTQDAGARIRAAALPPTVAGRLANLLGDIAACRAVTAAGFATLTPGRLADALRTGAGLDPTQFAGIRGCAQRVWTATGELELALRQPAAAADECTPVNAAPVDIWPVLRFEPSCADHTYPNDYLLVVDAGGNDTYRNNAGSNLVDVNFSPAGSAVTGLRGVGPAKGCQRAIPGLTAADCLPAAAVLLDLQGRDTYGVRETPDHDAGCTTDPVVRRMMTGGAGFLGVGILRDADSSPDRYTGKTGSLGAGHIFGVGMLSDAGGDDTYDAVRNSQGFALVGGFGLLRDEAGDDTYGFTMPAPIDPAAPNQTEGAGGVRDDEGEGLCDRIPRFTQGAANVTPASVGLLIDDAGRDDYHGAFVVEFTGPFQIPSVRAGSLGFGNNQSLGVFVDRGGDDVYRADGEPAVAGVPRRGNGTTVAPGNDSTGSGAGAGLFIDG
ncbi:hypothetical protein SAMN05444365_109102 [Micromonospora pattaloongensis]|uniref:Uncharacterized protein n=1 Tax=Micromonospora pattaloongensis TaxID=405436 RepID=A0A1H3RX48_9ACTN|nr:hypothetical protein [Micromonospora pattaloongensis]SDZ29439.1 hypothetical protein SAMN05444365_109102 [Micromonospora pattaloongensis]